jgi:hypothetical protein
MYIEAVTSYFPIRAFAITMESENSVNMPPLKMETYVNNRIKFFTMMKSHSYK